MMLVLLTLAAEVGSKRPAKRPDAALLAMASDALLIPQVYAVPVLVVPVVVEL